MGEVVVLGSINMDIVAAVRRFPHPGETLSGESLNYFPGGKGANQAVAAARAGAQTRMAGKVGNDAFAGTLLDFLGREGIDISRVGRSQTAPSGTALIALSKGENAIIVIPGSNAELTPAEARAVPLSGSSVAVAQLETPQETVRAFFENAKAAGARTVFNPSPAVPCDREIFKLADVMIMNETETSSYAGGSAAMDARAFLQHDRQAFILTLGASGLVLVDRDRDVEISGRRVQSVDTTGAGDCFAGNFAASLAAGLDLRAAAERANAAAALSVQKHGAGPSMPYAAEVDAFLRGPAPRKAPSP
jgi:ribokinase